MTTAANANRRRPIPVPSGGFKSNEQEARWLAQTIEMRAEVIKQRQHEEERNG
jgi:hypothetical protein